MGSTMTATLTALLFIHLLVQFVLLPPKPHGHPARFRHRMTRRAFVVLIVAVATFGALHPVLFVPAFAGLAIDAVRPEPGLRAYLAVQAAHLAVILVTAGLVPGLWQAGYWADRAPGLPVLLAYAGGAILATRAGQVAVGHLMAGHTAAGAPADMPADGLPRGGATIGLLERGLIFVLILAGEIGAIGFLIAAKSILRFGTVAENRAASEYVIIGTLASFGWAILAALATRELVTMLSAA